MTGPSSNLVRGISWSCGLNLVLHIMLRAPIESFVMKVLLRVHPPSLVCSIIFLCPGGSYLEPCFCWPTRLWIYLLATDRHVS